MSEPHLIRNGQKSTNLYQNAVEALFMDFAHCVTGKCICVFLIFPEVQKCYVFRHCALCKTGSPQWSVFETGITMS